MNAISSSSLGDPAADFRAGVIATIPICISAVPFALLLGAIASQKGFALIDMAVMSAFIFAGASQFILVEQWTADSSLIFLVLTVFLVNIRHILMGAAIAPHMRGTMSSGRSMIALYFMTDETWATGLKQATKRPLTFAYMMGCGLALYSMWLATTMLGHQLGNQLPDPALYGFDFAFPVIFLILICSLYQGKQDFIPWAMAAMAACIAYLYLPSPWYIVIGGITGTVFGAFRRLPDASEQKEIV